MAGLLWSHWACTWSRHRHTRHRRPQSSSTSRPLQHIALTTQLYIVHKLYLFIYCSLINKTVLSHYKIYLKVLVSRTGAIADATAVPEPVFAAAVQPAKRVLCRQVRVSICNSTGTVLISTITICYH